MTFSGGGSPLCNRENTKKTAKNCKKSRFFALFLTFFDFFNPQLETLRKYGSFYWIFYGLKRANFSIFCKKWPKIAKKRQNLAKN